MAGSTDKISLTLDSIRRAIKDKFGDDGQTRELIEGLISSSEDRVWYELRRTEEAIRHIPGSGGGGQPTNIQSLSPELIVEGQDYQRSIQFDGSGYAKKTDLLTSQEHQYLDDLISTGALDRIYWSVIVTTTQAGSITTDRVYLNIIPDVLTTESSWSITHNDGSVLERTGKQITYTKGDTVVILSDENGAVLEHKFHIPAELTVTAFDGNPSDDINNVYISVEFDIHSLHEVIGDTDSLMTTEKVVVKAINEVRERLSRINAGDRFINFDPDTGWNVGLSNDTHGGHIRLLDKTGAVFLDIDVAAYGSGLEAVFAITFIGGEFNPAASYAQGDRAHHRKAITLTGWPEVTECTLAYTAKDTISPGPWDESEWYLRDDPIAGVQINTYTQIAKDGFIFVATHQMTWDHEPALDEFIQDDWYLINRLPVIPGKFAIFMLDNSLGQAGWLAADELAPFTGTSTIDIDAQGNVSVILNTGGILERTSAGLLLKWYLNDGVYTLGSDGNTKFYDTTAIDTKLGGKQNNPTQQSANMVYAGPASGNAAIPTYRKLVAADIPNLSADKITEGVLAKERGGTGNANGTADKLTTARKISITGAAVGNANFDGSNDITIEVKANYSTAEVATGNSYIDGKMIYQKTFTGTFPVTAANTKARIQLMTGVDKIINTTGNIINVDGTGTAVPVNAWYEGLLLSSLNSTFFVDGSNIMKFAFKCSAEITSTSNMTYEITVQYTKA
jgi:hypothetical protein